MFRLIVSVVFVFVVYTQTYGLVYGQKYCCYPVQWEGQQGSTTGSADDEGHTAVTVGNANISYDVTNQRFFVSQALVSGNNSRSYQILQLYKQNVEYIIDNGQCTRVPLKDYNPSTNCIPDNATMTHRYTFGRKQSMLMTEYMWNQGQVTVMLDVNDDCVPVASKSYGNVNGDDIMQGVGSLGITPGIKDTSVFNIPSICNAPIQQELAVFDGPVFLTTLKI